jgi:tetratricopeptide (TPR) repeat protein
VNEALTEAVLGQGARAREKAKAALGSSRGGFIAVDASLALVLVGALDEARPPLEDVAKRFPVNTLYQRIALPTVRAAFELQRGEPAKVLELLEGTARYELASVVPYFSIYLRAQAHQRAGRGQDAEREYQKILDHRGVDAFSLLLPLSRLGLARAAALSGDVARSRRAYQDFLAHWKDADADIPVLREARAEYAKLQDR